MLHAGVDLHKKFSVVSVIDDDGQLLIRARAGQRRGRDKEFLASFDSEVRWYWKQGRTGTGCATSWMRWEWRTSSPTLQDQGDRLCQDQDGHPGLAVLAKLLRSDFIAEAYKADHETRQLRSCADEAYLVRSRAGTRTRCTRC